jgi:hypothetical protein
MEELMKPLQTVWEKFKTEISNFEVESGEIKEGTSPGLE